MDCLPRALPSDGVGEKKAQAQEKRPLGRVRYAPYFKNARNLPLATTARVHCISWAEETSAACMQHTVI